MLEGIERSHFGEVFGVARHHGKVMSERNRGDLRIRVGTRPVCECGTAHAVPPSFRRRCIEWQNPIGKLIPEIMHRLQQGGPLVWRGTVGAVISFRHHDGCDHALGLVGLKESENLSGGALLGHFADNICVQEVSQSSLSGWTWRLSRGPTGTRPKRRNPSRKLPARRGSILIARNDGPSSCQSNVTPDFILNRSRNALGTTVWPLLVTVLVLVRISFFQPLLASEKGPSRNFGKPGTGSAASHQHAEALGLVGPGI